jgi:cytidylate kinase
MIQVITVEREYGTQGAEYARRMAEHLGWELIDQSLVDEVAKRANVPAPVAQKRDEQLDPWYNKVGRAFWHGSNERASTMLEQEIFDATRMTGLIQQVMEEKARAGKCVIVGRGAACALHGIPGCFHVFVYASMARKIRWFEQAFPAKAHFAERELLATDRRRAEYVEHFYHNVWNDYRLYHLMLNSCMGFEAMIGATIEATGI